MLKSCIGLLFLSLAYSFVFSQANFKPGYIVLKNGDTARGMINYRNWEINPVSIEFEGNSSRKQYSAGDLLAFGVTGLDIYRSFAVTYHQSADKLEDAGKEFGDKIESGQYFMRLLHESSISLYGLKTLKRDFFFIQETNVPLKELIYRVRIANGILTEDEQYKNLLSQYVPEEKKAVASRNLEKMDYRQKDLIGFLNILQTSAQAKTSITKPRVKYDIGAGINFLNYGGSLVDYSFALTPGFHAGGGFTFSSPRNFGKFQSRAGLDVNYLPVKAELTGMPTLSADTEGYFFTLRPSGSIGLVLNPLSTTKSSLHFEVGYHFILSYKFELSNTTASSGFASIALKYQLSGPFGALGAGFGLLSNFLDSAPGGELFNAKQLFLTYSYSF